MNRLCRNVVLLSILALPGCLPDDDNDPIADWVGSWTVRETQGEFAPQTYTLEISRSASLMGDKVTLRGLYAQGSNFAVSGDVTNAGLTIPLQTRDGFTISGEAKQESSNNAAKLTFSIDDGSGNDNVVAIMER
jgi:hypothetical protein